MQVSLNDKQYTIKGRVGLFPQAGGWHYLHVPKKITQETRDFAERGLVAVEATINEHSWSTSLLPMGDDTHFIALPASVRNKFHIEEGDVATVTFKLRER